jgi:hypothetical protein
MYGSPPYNYGPSPRRMYLCPGCGMQTPYGYACGGCYTPWDPTAFLVAELIEEIIENEVFDGPHIVEEVVVEDYDTGGGDGYYDGGYDDGGGW